jgi:exosortase
MQSETYTSIRKNFVYLIAIILFLIYLPTLYDLVIDWSTDANYSHGFLIPLISGYLLWRKRKELSNLSFSSNRWGLAIIILGMIFFILGNGASEYFTVRLSLVITIFGLIMYLYGSPLIRHSWFEILFLVFMIPIPYVIYFSATFPMQLLASKITSGILHLIGMSAVRQGNIIHLPNHSLEVAEACSGMRSLVSLLALGAIYAHLTQKRLSSKMILFLSTIPIAVIANIFRVFITALIVYISDIDVTNEPIHSLMGASVFVVAFISLFIFGAILRRLMK